MDPFLGGHEIVKNFLEPVCNFLFFLVVCCQGRRVISGNGFCVIFISEEVGFAKGQAILGCTFGFSLSCFKGH